MPRVSPAEIPATGWPWKRLLPRPQEARKHYGRTGFSEDFVSGRRETGLGFSSPGPVLKIPTQAEVGILDRTGRGKWTEEAREAPRVS